MDGGAHISACPACDAAPLAEATANRTLKDATLMLSLPGVHCAACIDTVENALKAGTGVHDARVNLTMKRAQVKAAPGVEAEDLIRLVEAAGYEAHELDAGTIAATATDRAGRELLMRLAVAGFAAMNVMLLSVAVWSGATGASRDMFHWVSAVIALPAIAFCAQPFFRNAWKALKVGHLNMDVPISLAIVLALGSSLWETMLSGPDAYFDAALSLTFFLLAGRYLDHRTRSAARSAAEELTALEVPRAVLLRNGEEVVVPVAELSPGDLILVRPGSRMPVDGEIVAGHSELDRSLLTGETRPEGAFPGQVVSAGEVNLSSPLTVRATATGRDTSLARMADLVELAESGRARYTPLADRAARLYAPGVHIVAALSFLGWAVATGDLRLALNIAAAVLIITCPCALGLAVPAVTTAASGRLFRAGLLVKHETALERLAHVDAVIFDKTGTLTVGRPQPVDAEALEEEARAVALTLAQASSHPLSRALVTRLRDLGTGLAEVEDLYEVPGHGVEARRHGQILRLGRADWVGAEWVGAEADGEQTATWLRIGDATPQPVHFADLPRSGAAEAVAELGRMGLRVMLLSGDAEGPVRGLAETLGIYEWQAGARPVDKARQIRDLQEQGLRILMVGDGLNDTLALTSADVSISPASALDAARVASDVVLLGSDLSPIPAALRTASRAERRIRENFRIAAIYNVIAVPLAAAGLASPLIAALAMSASSITVSLNALRLR